MSTQTFSDPATWNSRYGEDGYQFGVEPNAFLSARQTLFQPGRRALAVADGDGRNSVWLASLGLQVDAFDFAAVGVEKARALAQARGVRVNYQVCDCDSWPWEPETYDYVVAIFVQFADPAMRERLFANMKRTLKPGGYLVLQGYTPKQLEYKTGGPPCAEHLYTEALLQSQFADLDIVEMRSYEENLEEGTRHTGKSALIGMVARKPTGMPKD